MTEQLDGYIHRDHSEIRFVIFVGRRRSVSIVEKRADEFETHLCPLDPSIHHRREMSTGANGIKSWRGAAEVKGKQDICVGESAALAVGQTEESVELQEGPAEGTQHSFFCSRKEERHALNSLRVSELHGEAVRSTQHYVFQTDDTLHHTEKGQRSAT